MHHSVINQIKNLVKEGKLREALETLLQLTAKIGDKVSHNEVLVILGRLSQTEREERTGIAEPKQSALVKANISAAILSLLDGLEARKMEDSLQTSLEREADAPASANLPLWVGALSTLLVFATVLFLPCPTDVQYVVFRILLSVGAAGMAAAIPGFFTLKYKQIVSAGGALAVFGFVYAYNPAMVSSFKNCNGPFEYSLKLESAGAKPLFDAKFRGKIQLQLDNDVRSDEVDDFGVADFKAIPSNFLDKTVTVELDFRGWQFAATHSERAQIALSGKSANLAIEPDGSLSKVSGSVRDEQNRFVAGAGVSIGPLSAKTDTLGRFSLEIPAPEQREEQKMTVFKPGFTTRDLNVYPGLREEIVVILKKQK